MRALVLLALAAPLVAQTAPRSPFVWQRDYLVGPDKIEHAAAGFVTAELAAHVFTRGPRTSASIGCIAGVAKEVWDYRELQRMDPRREWRTYRRELVVDRTLDAAITCLGAMLAAATDRRLDGRNRVVHVTLRIGLPFALAATSFTRR